MFFSSQNQLAKALRLVKIRFFTADGVPTGIVRVHGFVAALVKIRIEAVADMAEVCHDQRKRYFILQNPAFRRDRADKAQALGIRRNGLMVKVRIDRPQRIDLDIDILERVFRAEKNSMQLSSQTRLWSAVFSARSGRSSVSKRTSSAVSLCMSFTLA